MFSFVLKVAMYAWLAAKCVYWEVNLQLLAWLVARCHCAVVLEAKAAAVETCWLVRRLVVSAAASLFALALP
jgi:hypothetical protein